jgi:hypothetical protein
LPQLQISRITRAAILARLSDPDTGFAPRLTASFIDAGISPPIGVQLPISYAPGSRNFFQANIWPKDLDESTTVTYPFQTLYSDDSRNANLEKFATFAGPVQIGLNCFWSWKASAGLYDMETPGDCYEEAFYGTFNDPAIADWSQTFDGRIVFNGDISLKRTKITMDAENWIQGFLGVIGVDVHQIS